MKKIILLIFLVFIPVAIAEDLRISLIEYNPDTGYARIQIENTAGTDLHNVQFQLDTLPARLITPIMQQSASTARVLTIPAGIHTITIISDEGTFKKDLSFQASVQEKLEEYESSQREQRREIAREQAFKQELEKNKPITEEKNNTKIIIIAIIFLLIIAIVAYIILSRKKHENI